MYDTIQLILSLYSTVFVSMILDLVFHCAGDIISPHEGREGNLCTYRDEVCILKNSSTSLLLVDMIKYYPTRGGGKNI